MKEEGSGMNKIEQEDLKSRTKRFSLRVIQVYSASPKTTEARVIGRQMLRSGTSVGAHYRDAVRSRSTAKFINKIEEGLQELEKTVYWLELLIDSGIFTSGRLKALMMEADELMAVLVTCAKNAKRKRK